MDNLDTYNKLANLFVEVVQSQKGMKTEDNEEYLYYAESLAIKLFNHLATMKQVSSGLNMIFQTEEFSHVDHGSVTLVARAAFETYLTFYYVFVDPETVEERKFRFQSWKLAGLKDRQKFHVISKEGAEVKDSESILIDDLKTEIKESTVFKSLIKKEQKAILRGDWKNGKYWKDLAKIANFYAVMLTLVI